MTDRAISKPLGTPPPRDEGPRALGAFNSSAMGRICLSRSRRTALRSLPGRLCGGMPTVHHCAISWLRFATDPDRRRDSIKQGRNGRRRLYRQSGTDESRGIKGTDSRAHASKKGFARRVEQVRNRVGLSGLDGASGGLHSLGHSAAVVAIPDGPVQPRQLRSRRIQIGGAAYEPLDNVIGAYISRHPVTRT